MERSARPGPPQLRRESMDRSPCARLPWTGSRPLHRSPDDGLLGSPPGLFAKTHSQGHRGQRQPMHPCMSPQTNRGSEAAAISKVGERKLCTLWSHQESLPSNCPGEKLLWTLSWLVTQLPAPKRPSCPVIFPRAQCDPLAIAGLPRVWASHRHEIPKAPWLAILRSASQMLPQEG